MFVTTFFYSNGKFAQKEIVAENKKIYINYFIESHDDTDIFIGHRPIITIHMIKLVE